MKKTVRVVLAAIFAMSMCLVLVGCGGSSSSSSYKDGTYTGEGQGHGGPIDVTLTVASGKITDVEITQTGETVGVGGYEAIEDGTFAQQIIDAQGSSIDGVSGATYTTQGVKDAVDAALAQAK